MKIFTSSLVGGGFAKALSRLTGNLPILNTGVAAVAARLAARSLPMTLAVAGTGLAIGYLTRKSQETDSPSRRRKPVKRTAAKRAKPRKAQPAAKKAAVPALAS